MKLKLLIILLCVLPFNVLSSTKLSLGAAVWDFFDNQDVHGVHISLEFPKQSELYDFNPTFLMIRVEEGHSYLALGLNKTLSINEDFNWGFGSHIGLLDTSEELGHKVEFYSKIFVEYQLSHHSAIALETGHISNAGFGDINPGSESLVLSYSRRF